MKPLWAVLFLVTSLAHAALAPYGLEVEARSNPLGIDTLRPRLGWRLTSKLRGDRQTAYQVLVATDARKLQPGQADVWDSGRIQSNETSWVGYKGAGLKSFSRYWWTVRVWDGAGTASPWSAPAEWTMAIVRRADWKASWIHHGPDRLSSGPLPIFRKEISLDRPVRRALAAISGVGFHELRVNGRKAGDHVLAPAWSNYRDTVYYELLDVTGLLKPGANALGILLGNGFFNVAGGRYAKYTASFGHPRVLFQLHLEYTDGSVQDFASGPSWRAKDGPLTFSCIYGGEDYDARAEPDGWDKPGFDDSAWSPVSGGEGAGGDMRAQSSPPIKVQKTLTTSKITRPRPGTWVYDLGQNFAGWPRIEVSGRRGAEVRLIPGELLDTSGLVTQASSGGPQWFSYTLRGTGREVWAPRFSYYGFRYVQVEGAVPEVPDKGDLPIIHRLEGEFIHLDAPRIGYFHASNDLINRIHDLIGAAIQSNLQHVLTDCPHREKLGWLEQLYLMGPSLLYNWDLRTFLPKAARDIREAQIPNGLVPGIAPEYVVFGWGHEGFRDSPEWGSAALFAPWLAWQWYGDRNTLEQAYSTGKRYLDYLRTRAGAGILKHGLGDWYDIGPGSPGPSQLTPPGVTATATWYAGLKTWESAARLLGREQDASNYSSEAGRVLGLFQDAFYRPDRSSYANGSQTALAMPLVLGIAPAQARASLLEKLVSDVRKRGNHTSAGDVGYTYVVRALMEGDRSDVLYDMTTRVDPPSYGAQLAAGATSLTEAWDANPHSSQNHLMLGHIEQWFYGGLAGIRLDARSPGMRHLIIEPNVVGDLGAVQARLDTFRGVVSVQWRVEAGSLRVALELPPGVDGTVRLPSSSADRVRESGRAASAAPAVRFVAQQGSRSVFHVESGAYDFEITGFRR